MPFENFFDSEVDIHIYFSLKATAMHELFGDSSKEEIKQS
jgi:hypothetical protein